METSTTSADYTVTFDEDESLIDMQPSGKTTTNFYPFTLKNGTAYTLAVQTDLFVVQQATKVLLSILPYVILCERIGFGHTKGFNIRNGKYIQRRYSLSGYRRWTNQR